MTFWISEETMPKSGATAAVVPLLSSGSKATDVAMFRKGLMGIPPNMCCVHLVETLADLMGQRNRVADLHLVREVELRILIGLLVVKAADHPALLAHDLNDLLDLGGNHAEVGGHGGRRTAAVKRLEGDRRGDVQEGINGYTAQHDPIPPWDIHRHDTVPAHLRRSTEYAR